MTTSTLCLSSPPIRSPARSLSIWELKSAKSEGKEILLRILIFKLTITSRLTMSMVQIALSRQYMRTLLDKQWFQYWRATTRQFWPTGKRGPAKLTQWRALNTLPTIPKGGSFPDLWRKYSDIYRMAPIKARLSWSELLTCKYTMKTFLIC
jgi:hypothetical protein